MLKEHAILYSVSKQMVLNTTKRPKSKNVRMLCHELMDGGVEGWLCFNYSFVDSVFRETIGAIETKAEKLMTGIHVRLVKQTLAAVSVI